MARIKYIRVSTKEQNTARQEQDKALYDKIYLEKISGQGHQPPTAPSDVGLCARGRRGGGGKLFPPCPRYPATC